MKIAIIGTGNVGSALGGSFVRAGHDVTFAARDAAKAAEVAASVGAGAAAATAAEAAGAADVVVLAVPYGAVAEARRGDRDGRRRQGRHRRHQPAQGRTTRASPPGTARRAPSRSPRRSPAHASSKAFNTLFAGNQARPRGARHDRSTRSTRPTTRPPRTTVAALASSIGFRPVQVGPLAAARELEALAWLNIRLQMPHERRLADRLRPRRARRSPRSPPEPVARGTPDARCGRRASPSTVLAARSSAHGGPDVP